MTAIASYKDGTKREISGETTSEVTDKAEKSGAVVLRFGSPYGTMVRIAEYGLVWL